jgi:hypothetical protein
MVVCQQDSRPGKIQEARTTSPNVGQTWSRRCGRCIPTPQCPQRQGTAAQQVDARLSGRPLRGVLRLRTFAALRYREFRLLWSGQASTAMAMWMDQVVRGWLMYELTTLSSSAWCKAFRPSRFSCCLGRG